MISGSGPDAFESTVIEGAGAKIVGGSPRRDRGVCVCV